MKKIYTSEDILKSYKGGNNRFVVEGEYRFTDLAKDIIRKNDIEIITREENNSSMEDMAKEYIKLDINKSEDNTLLGNKDAIEEKLQRVIDLLETGHTAVPLRKDNMIRATDNDILIKNGTLIVPELGCLKSNLVIKDGEIAGITNYEPSAREVIDATGLYVAPGIIDPHTHLGLMASLELELETESKAAILGGITTVGCFFNHEGSYKETLDNVENSVRTNSRIDLVPHLTLRDGIHIDEMEDYIDRGIRAFKMYMCGIPGMIPHQEDGFIYNALKKIKELKKIDKNILVCIHAENTSIVDYAVNDDFRINSTTLREWEMAHPQAAEAEAIQRTAFLSDYTGVKIYIVHVSSKDSMEIIKCISNDNLKIETTSPYLTIDTNSEIGVYGKMLPPIRNPESREALWEGIRNGLIDTIGTDNVTMTSDEKMVKKGMGKAIPGYPALATHLVSIIDEGVLRRGIPIEQIIPLMTLNPARIFNIYPQKGTILPGSDADVVLIDINRRERVTRDRIMGRSDFSLYDDRVLSGWPCATIKAGKIVAWDGKLVDDVYRGQVLR